MKSGWIRRVAISVMAALSAAYAMVAFYVIFFASDESVEKAFDHSVPAILILGAMLVAPVYWLLARPRYQDRLVATGKRALLGSIVAALVVGALILSVVLGSQ